MDDIMSELFKTTLPLPRFECVDTAPENRRTRSISPLTDFIRLCQPDPTIKHTRTRMQLEAAAKQNKQIKHTEWLKDQIKAYNPRSDSKISGNPSCTAFVAKLRYTTTKQTLREFFARYGVVESVNIVVDLNQKSRGYAFIVFAQPQDVETACREANNALVDGARLLVDSERGRLQRNWLPARLGGGIGGRVKKVTTIAPNTSFRAGFAAARGSGAPRGRDFSRGRGRGGFRGRPYDRPEGSRSSYNNNNVNNRPLHHGAHRMDYDRPQDPRADHRHRPNPRMDQRHNRPLASRPDRDSRGDPRADPRAAVPGRTLKRY